MQDDPRYDDVVTEVRDLLADRAARAADAGVQEIWIDPGIGFGKTVDHNLQLLVGLDALVATGYPVLVGTSRKGFLGVVGAGPDGAPVPADQRLPASLATATYALHRGAGMVRVHDVAATVQAALLVGRVAGGPGSAGSMLETEDGS
jgi:dihydropteroate synthase